MSGAQGRREKLLEQARQLPRTPGVYLMKDAEGRVIYVGKATRLRDRVSSYFQRSAVFEGKKEGLQAEIADFETIDCEGEWDALLTENRLIKDIHPRFNARMTDDKTYPYLVITKRDDFPGVYVTREPTSPQYRGAKVFGPFTSAGGLREAVQLMQKIFKFRTCHLEIREDDPERRHFRPCLLHPIDQCTAPCAAKIDKQRYREDIDRLIRFLESKRSTVLRELKQEMEQASERLEYERAATLRDQIRAIERLDERGRRSDQWQPETEAASLREDPAAGLEHLQKRLGLAAPPRSIEAIDIAHLQGGETVGSKVAFVDGRPLKEHYRRYRIRSVDNDDYAAIAEVVARRYRDAGAGHELYPDLILIDGGAGQLHAATSALEALDHQPPRIVGLAKKEELVHTPERDEPIRLPRTNPGLKILQAIRDEAHRFAQHYHHILRRKKVVGE